MEGHKLKHFGSVQLVNSFLNPSDMMLINATATYALGNLNYNSRELFGYFDRILKREGMFRDPEYQSIRTEAMELLDWADMQLEKGGDLGELVHESFVNYGKKFDKEMKRIAEPYLSSGRVNDPCECGGVLDDEDVWIGPGDGKSFFVG